MTTAEMLERMMYALGKLGEQVASLSHRLAALEQPRPPAPAPAGEAPVVPAKAEAAPVPEQPAPANDPNSAFDALGRPKSMEQLLKDAADPNRFVYRGKPGREL